MSDYSVISSVSSTLKGLLDSSITQSADPQLHNVPIDLHSPKEIQQSGPATAVSVWLYNISRMPEMLNDPPERLGSDQMARVSLPVLMYYLITPMTVDPLARHALLGKVLQVFLDNAIVRGADLKGVLEGTSEQLRVNLEALTLEELSLVWYALGEPYQLSVTYLVQVVKIDSDREPIRTKPVLRREVRYAQILAET